MKKTQRFFASHCSALNDGKNGFTLAEVLITLTIIGVIAALTIPNLMQNYKKHERITQIKEAYSIIQNATKMAIAEHGNPDGWDFNASHEYAPKYFVPYIKVQKECGTGTAGAKATGCFINNGNNGMWHKLNGADYGSGSGYGADYYYTMILQNGMHVGIWAPAKVLQPMGWHTIYFIVDVNGQQGPTTLGKDVFTFTMNIDTSKFSAGGRPDNYNTNDCTLSSSGNSCAYWIEKNHWDFPDDYPVKSF